MPFFASDEEQGPERAFHAAHATTCYDDRVRVTVAVLLACAVAPAAAQPKETVALASSDPSFRAALAAALSPSGTGVIDVEAEPPALGDLTAGSRAVADREHATGTVWLIAAPSGSTLVAYDRAVDRVLVRELPYTLPLSATQAAEAARVTRTMLRALHAMPEAEQTPPPKPPPVAEIPIAPVAPVERAPILGASLAADVHLWGPASDVVPAAALTAIWRPTALGIAAEIALAPSADLVTPAFDGGVRDSTVAIAGRFPLRVTPHLAVAAELGAALHFVRVEGVLVDGEPIDTTAIDPALRFGFTGAYAVSREVEIGLGVATDTLLRRQMYDAGSDRILIISRLQVVVGAFVSMQIL